MVNKINVQWESDWRKLEKWRRQKIYATAWNRYIFRIYHDENESIYGDGYVDDADDDDKGDIDDNVDDERALCSMTFFYGVLRHRAV